MTLTKCEYIWEVNYISMDDGLSLTDSYWTSLTKAEDRAREINGTINQTTLFRNENDYYKVRYVEVMVDPPSKKEILKKLTIKERKVLGIENF